MHVRVPAGPVQHVRVLAGPVQLLAGAGGQGGGV